MSEAEKLSFFAHTNSRGAGKRQIKPTAAVLDLILPPDDEDEDEDFDLAKEEAKESDEDSGSNSEDSDEDEEENEDEEEEDSLDHNSHLNEQGPIICALCLNLREIVKSEEIMQCDKCGLAVHESCYLPDVVDDTDSNHSSSTTEPWFCEPCIYGLKEPPYCELCPNRYGAFKRSDVGGRWVHQVCALYTKDMTFGDIDHLTAVSWQELDHRSFGRKSCGACNNKLEARTGVVTRCELGMCKEFLHITCAQRLGLLVDHSDEAATGNENIAPRYVNCKRHSNSDDAKIMKTAYAKFEAQEVKRMMTMKRKVLTEREERKRQRARKHLDKTYQALVGLTISWPEPEKVNDALKVRRCRQLHTSGEFLEQFKEKAELANIDSEQFEKEFLRIRGDSLPFLAPGFSEHFIEYFNNRERNVFVSEQKRLEALHAQNTQLKERLGGLQADYTKVSTTPQRCQLEDVSSKLRKIFDALKKVGVSSLTEPACFSFLGSGIASKTPAKASARTKSTPATTKKATPTKSVTFHTCDECKGTNDQHSLVDCDSCHAFFHLGCLDPPLERMPKTANFDWYCMRCCEEDDEEEQEVEIDEDESSREGKPRKLRHRSDSIKAKKVVEAEEQARAFRAAISRRAPAARKRKSDAAGDMKKPTISPRAKVTKKENVEVADANGKTPNGRSSALSHASSTSTRRSNQRSLSRLSNGLPTERVLSPALSEELGEDSFVTIDENDLIVPSAK